MIVMWIAIMDYGENMIVVLVFHWLAYTGCQSIPKLALALAVALHLKLYGLITGHCMPGDSFLRSMERKKRKKTLHVLHSTPAVVEYSEGKECFHNRIYTYVPIKT